MVHISKDNNITLPERLVKEFTLYSDRNGVYNNLQSISQNTIERIREKVNQIYQATKWRLLIISNESEDSRSKVIKKDIENRLYISENNYNLSTQSAARFIKETLGYSTCYYVGGPAVMWDIKSMWLFTINISHEEISSKNLSSFMRMQSLPILFARPPFAIDAHFKDDDAILQSIKDDISLKNIEYILKNSNSKVVFCHSKPNCNRKQNGMEFRELNLGFYFEFLKQKFDLNLGENIFDLGKDWFWNWEFFRMALKRDNDFHDVIGIGDMMSDVEHTIMKWWIWILVQTWDCVVTEKVKQKIDYYKNRFFLIPDLTYLFIN